MRRIIKINPCINYLTCRDKWCRYRGKCGINYRFLSDFKTSDGILNFVRDVRDRRSQVCTLLNGVPPVLNRRWFVFLFTTRALVICNPRSAIYCKDIVNHGFMWALNGDNWGPQGPICCPLLLGWRFGWL